MWVYRGDSLRRRSHLNPHVGCWLDYLLFMYRPDAYPVYAVRPLGVHVLAEAALKLVGSSSDQFLRRQLKTEMLSASRLLTTLQVPIAQPSTDIDLQSTEWPPEWVQWLDNVIAHVPQVDLVSRIISALPSVVFAGNAAATQYLTRRLAAELAATLSPSEVVQRAMTILLDDELPSSNPADPAKFYETLLALTSPGVKRAYEVLLTVAPVLVSREARIVFRGWKRVEAVIEQATHDSKRLVALRQRVEAFDAESAMIEAVGQAAKALEGLRLRHYLRTHLYGTAEIHDLTSGEVLHVSLPAPFWMMKHPSSRPAPTIPGGAAWVSTRLVERDGRAWLAARWHLSRAIGNWAEDISAAAAQVWQGLESLTTGRDGRAFARVVRLSEQYLQIATSDMAEFLRNQVRSQAFALQRIGGPHDWYYSDPHRAPIKEWVRRILRAGSQNYDANSQNPTASDLLFHPRLGLSARLNGSLRRMDLEPWMLRRLRWDLGLLYGHRNRVVHTGQTLFSPVVASYLGRVGAEILIAVIAHSARLISKVHVSGEPVSLNTLLADPHWKTPSLPSS